jgi:hypothetical protein
MTLRSTRPKTEMITRNISWRAKGAGAVCVEILGALTSWNTKGMSSFVMGWLYYETIWTNIISGNSKIYGVGSGDKPGTFRYSYLQAKRPNNFNLLNCSHLPHLQNIFPIVQQGQINKFATCSVRQLNPMRKRTKAKVLRKILMGRVLQSITQQTYI